jgi:hypothetical protein
MAQTATRLNLASAAFPFLSEFSGRGIIVKQTDQNYVPTVTSKEDLDKDIGIPQVYYCHNVIATGQGFQAVSFPQAVTAVLPTKTNFLGVLAVIDDTGNKIYIGWDAAGVIYKSVPPLFSIWSGIQTIPAFGTKVITSCVVNGVTYIYVANTGCYKYDFGTNQLVSQTLTGITPANALGILACQGYMLVYSTNAVLWSSLVDPTDFTPSLTTGAGGGAVQNLRGDVVCVIPHTIGFIVYSNQNAVSASFSNNTRYPFNFKELVASGGLFDKRLVTYDSNTGSHYAYTTSGLQLISIQQAQTTIPELTDFIAGAVFEDFDENTDQLTQAHLAAPMKKKLTLVADRYLVISYGISELTHALVFDTVMKRWSKLKVTHVDCFEFGLLQAETSVETPRRSMAFLKANGSVVTMKIDTRDSTASGVLLLGKLQFRRERLTSLFSLDVENIEPGSTFSIRDFYTLDGKTTHSVDGYLSDPDNALVSQARRYLFNVAAINHSFLFKGNFNLVSLSAVYSVHGRR